MRVDKFLKVSRLIKRRSVANQACAAGAVRINEKDAKPGSKIKIGDILEIELGTKIRKYEIVLVSETMPKGQVGDMYREI